MTFAPRIEGGPDARLSARVLGRRPLRYADGGDPAGGRPSHVRAGSGLCWVEHRFAVVQDDAPFVALVDVTTASAEAVALPVSQQVAGGGKSTRLDLESALVHRVVLIAFGSGATRMRERIAIVPRIAEPGAAARARVIDAAELYAGLRGLPELGGDELNLEGAAVVAERAVLLQRGNGAVRDGRVPVDAVIELDLVALERHLADPGRVAPPRPLRVACHDLGRLDGVRLTFSDAAARGPELWFLATAEDSPNAIDDGLVVGSVLGVLDAAARWTRVTDAEGAPFPGKLEGLVFDPREPCKAWAVTDPDDAERPAELCEIELRDRRSPTP